jgi:predicted HAD superfamily Cof-like phosphohydrolase
MTKTTRFDDVRAFHEACGLPVGDRAAPGLTYDEARLRAKLIMEEVAETMHALGLTKGQVLSLADWACRWGDEWPEQQQDVKLVELADGLADIAYVVEGTAVQAGLPSEEVWHEVQRSNMAKAGGPVVDGKQQKPEDWTPPDVAGVLDQARKAAKG